MLSRSIWTDVEMWKHIPGNTVWWHLATNWYTTRECHSRLPWELDQLFHHNLIWKLCMLKTMPEAHPHEDLEDSKDTAEAGQSSQPDMPPSSGDVAASSIDDALGPDAHGQKRQEEDAGQEASPKRAKFADSAFSLLESTFLLDDTETQHVPKTPKLSDDSSKKQVSQVTSTDLSLYEHEDNPVAFSFQQDDLDELEKYDMNFDDEDYYAGVEADDDASLQELTFPFSAHEPCLSETELLRLDTIADALEFETPEQDGGVNRCQFHADRCKSSFNEVCAYMAREIGQRQQAHLAEEITFCCKRVCMDGK